MMLVAWPFAIMLYEAYKILVGNALYDTIRWQIGQCLQILTASMPKALVLPKGPPDTGEVQIRDDPSSL